MDYITVAVSTFYNGRGWTDQATGITFEPTQTLKPIRIKTDGTDLSGIRNSVRLNNLLLLQGDLSKAAENPSINNPEELTNEQFKALLQGINGGDNGLQDKLDAANARIAELESQLSQVSIEQDDAGEIEIDDPVSSVQSVEEDANDSIDEDARRADLQKKTVTQLKELADEMEIEYASAIRKDDLIDLIIAKELEG